MVAITTVGIATSRLQADDGKLSLRVDGAAHATVGRPFTLKLTASNFGKTQFYFKKPWKWGKGGIHIVAKGEDQSIHESTTLNYDIDGQYTCTFSKPLSPGEAFSFEVSMVIGPEPVIDPSSHPSPEVVEALIHPHLELTPGRYKVRWVYEPSVFDYDLACAVADVPVWRGRAESQEMDLDVGK